jgi:hypothetical protein
VTQHLVFRLDTYTGKTWQYVVNTQDGIDLIGPRWSNPKKRKAILKKEKSSGKVSR